MIIGAHSIVYSSNADADRAFFRDVLKLGSIDMGGGWLIFGLPPAEVALHPSDKNDVHELYLMCENVEELVSELEKQGVASTPVEDHGWGLVVHVTLPGGGKLGIYEPRHPRPGVAAAQGGRAAPRRAARGNGKKEKPAPEQRPAKKKAAKTPVKAVRELRARKPGKTAKPVKAAPKKKAKKQRGR